MGFIVESCQSLAHKLQSKIFRVLLMFALTISTATIEIIYGVRAHSNALIADGLISFAEGLCLIGVILVLRAAQYGRNKSNTNTFGHERLELLFGLLQEVFLLSLSLGIIVDAVNHIVNPTHVHDPDVMIILGGIGIIVGIIGMIMFWGYHHDHDIEEEINQTKKTAFSAMIKKYVKSQNKSGTISRQNTVVDTPLMSEPAQIEASEQPNKQIRIEVKPVDVQRYRPSDLDAFTYGNVEIRESRIYATLHALCLHSFMVLLESVIVVLSGFLIKLIPHIDPVTGEEINGWLKYVDPCLTLIMIVVIAVRAIPVIFSISKILIEAVPNGIDTQDLMDEIITAIPAIKSIHSLHIWRATAKDIYATLHAVCDEDIPLSTCTYKYGQEIQKILKSFCVRYFTVQFEYIPPDPLTPTPNYRCVQGLHRQRRGHTLEKPLIHLAKEAMTHIH